MKNHLFKGIPTDSPNGFVIRAAGRCHRAGLSTAQAVAAIEAYKPTPPFYRPFKTGEVSRAVKAAYRTQALPISQSSGSTLKWPAPNPVLQRQVIAANAHATVEALQSCSPEPLDQEPLEILPKLFPGNPLVCISKEFDDGTITLPLHALRHPVNRHQVERASFVVPNPMCARTGTSQDGKTGRPRTLGNTGTRQHIIVEIDDKALGKDEQAAILNYLAQYLPLVAVVDSGGKSLHGWFSTSGRTEDEAKKFFTHAVRIGADRAMWNRHQLCRMPNGWRRKISGQTVPPRRQRLAYFNPTNRANVSPVTH